jgi:4-amino-4-deoxy-L-arabinose transferase-like glycosyltransferase
LGALAVLSAFAFFCNLGADPLQDWDEAIHAKVAHEMMLNGDWLHPHYQGRPYMNKPPLTFWLRAVAFSVAGVSETSARFWPALFGWGTVMLVSWWVGRLCGLRAGWLSGLILVTSRLFTLSHAGRSAETDSTMLFFFALTVVCLWHGRVNPRWFLAAGAATACGWMAKGWIALVPWGFAAVAALLERPRPAWSWRQMAGGAGLGIALTLPWQLAMLAWQGREFFERFYWHESGARMLRAVEKHAAGPDFYLRVLHDSFQPWTALAVAVGLAALWRWKERRDARLIWFLAWAACVVSLCTVTATKLSWYVVPALPAIAVLAAVAAVELAGKRGGWVLLGLLAAMGCVETGMRWRWELLAGVAAALLAAACLVKAPSAARRWQVWVAAGCLAAALGCRGATVYREIVVRVEPSPWPAIGRRVEREFPGVPVLLVGYPFKPAAVYYLSLPDPRREVRSWALSSLGERARARERFVVLSPPECEDELRRLGMRECWREGGVVASLSPGQSSGFSGSGNVGSQR